LEGRWRYNAAEIIETTRDEYQCLSLVSIMVSIARLEVPISTL